MKNKKNFHSKKLENSILKFRGYLNIFSNHWYQDKNWLEYDKVVRFGYHIYFLSLVFGFQYYIPFAGTDYLDFREQKLLLMLNPNFDSLNNDQSMKHIYLCITEKCVKSIITYSDVILVYILHIITFSDNNGFLNK